MSPLGIEKRQTPEYFEKKYSGAFYDPVKKYNIDSDSSEYDRFSIVISKTAGAIPCNLRLSVRGFREGG